MNTMISPTDSKKFIDLIKEIAYTSYLEGRTGVGDRSLRLVRRLVSDISIRTGYFSNTISLDKQIELAEKTVFDIVRDRGE